MKQADEDTLYRAFKTFDTEYKGRLLPEDMKQFLRLEKLLRRKKLISVSFSLR